MKLSVSDKMDNNTVYNNEKNGLREEKNRHIENTKIFNHIYCIYIQYSILFIKGNKESSELIRIFIRF